jgi:ABC-2 type transport system ATP-binding protein
VQRNIGVTAQDATLDEVLTGRQNLVMVGRLSGLRCAAPMPAPGRSSYSPGSISPTPLTGS